MSHIIIAGTGHRPQRLLGGWKEYYSKSLPMLIELAISVLEFYQPTKVITGMALGWDTALALGAYKLQNSSNLDLVISGFLPYEGYEASWNPKNTEMFNKVKNLLDEFRIISDNVPTTKYAKANYDRDVAMVDNSNLVLAMYDGFIGGGTYETIRYAHKTDTTVINLWDIYESKYNLTS